MIFQRRVTKGLIVFALVFAVPIETPNAQPSPAPEQSQIMIVGRGKDKCSDIGKLDDARRTGWTLGYISGLASALQVNFLKDRDMIDMLKKISAQCRSTPDASLAEAIDVVLRDQKILK